MTDYEAASLIYEKASVALANKAYITNIIYDVLVFISLFVAFWSLAITRKMARSSHENAKREIRAYLFDWDANFGYDLEPIKADGSDRSITKIYRRRLRLNLKNAGKTPALDVSVKLGIVYNDDGILKPDIWPVDVYTDTIGLVAPENNFSTYFNFNRQGSLDDISLYERNIESLPNGYPLTIIGLIEYRDVFGDKNQYKFLRQNSDSTDPYFYKPQGEADKLTVGKSA